MFGVEGEGFSTEAEPRLGTGEGDASGEVEELGGEAEGQREGAETDLDDSSDESYKVGSESDASSCPSWMLEDFEGPEDDDIFANTSPTHARSMFKKYRQMLRESNKRKRAEERDQEWADLGREEAEWYSEEEVEGSHLLERDQEWAEGVDMGLFDLVVGMKFPTREVFKEVLQDWSVRKGYELKFIKNESKIITAKCKGGCDWSLRASVVQASTTFQIKTLKGKHTCAYRTHNNQADYKYLAKRILDTVKDGPNESCLTLKNKIKRDCGIECSMHKVYRAKKLALRLLSVDIAEQYNRLHDYCETVVKYNPNSRLVIKVNRDLNPPKFQRMYCCLAPMKEGFLSGCIPIIGLDGCFLKGLHAGQLLSAVGRDGNDNMYPLAIAYVEVEKRDSWEWFLKLLLDDIGSAEEKRWTFVSDRQKGLLDAVSELAPNSEHRFCLQHMYNNFKVKFRGLQIKKLFWKAASSYSVRGHLRVMSEIQRLSVKMADGTTAYEWLSEIDSKHWARCFFSPHSKCDVIVNNMSESFNNFILPCRDLPIIDMFEWIRQRCMTRIQVKRVGMLSYMENICPSIIKKIENQRKLSRSCFPSWAGEEKYEVMHFLENHIVNLKDKHCTCGFFELCGYPCCHAMACIGFHRLNVEDYVDTFLKKDVYLRVYSHSINPVPGMHDFEKSTLGPIIPPDVRVKRGRPKKKRRPDGNDYSEGVKASRKGLTHTCSICKVLGHNKRSCPNKSRSSDASTSEQGAHDQEQSEIDPNVVFDDEFAQQFGWALHQDQSGAPSVKNQRKQKNPKRRQTRNG